MICVHGVPMEIHCAHCPGLYLRSITSNQPPSQFQHQRETLIAYLRMKTDQADWHGVSDAANDLRVLEAQHPELLKP